jgi:hypothetical protein
MHQDVYQEVIEYFSSQEFQQEYHDARVEFESYVGGMSADHPFYETWVEAYIEYFTLDRMMPQYGLSAIELYAQMFAEKLSAQALQALSELAKAGLGCYRFVEKSNQQLTCVHEASQQLLVIDQVDEGHQLLLKKGDWVLMRLVTSSAGVHAFGAIWHFPKEITHWLKDRQQSFSSLWLFYMDCFKRKVFAEKYKHVDLQKIYEPMALPNIKTQGDAHAQA